MLPIVEILILKGLHAYVSGGFAVLGKVVDEKRIFGSDTGLVQYFVKNFRVGFLQMHLLREENAVEIVGHTIVPVRKKACNAIIPVYGIGIAEQVNTMVVRP